MNSFVCYFSKGILSKGSVGGQIESFQSLIELN